MDIQFLEAHELSSELPRLINLCDELNIAMAYVKYRGLKPLLTEINSLLDRNGTLKIVFGLSHAYGITDKLAAESLYKISKHKNAKVHKNNNPGFHPKLFIFKGDQHCIIIGSSNITEHAQSSNSEANVLIREPNSDFQNRVTAFFDYQFNEAPKLSRKDVEQYNPKRQPVKRSPKPQIPLDSLPTSKAIIKRIGDIQQPTLWKIAPGEDACLWPEWKKEIDDNGNGVIAIGWDIGDLKKIRKIDTIEKRVKNQAENNWNIGREIKVSEWYVTKQLWNFKKIKKGDIVVVYSECRIFGIAEVVEDSPYYYKHIVSMEYKHQVIVKYLWYHPWPERAEQTIVDTLGKRGTLRKIEEKLVWEHIKDHYFI